MTLIWLCAAFLAGIAAADWLDLPLVPALVVAVAASLLGMLWRKARHALALAIVAACAFGAARAAWARPVTDATSVWTYADQNVTLLGTVAHQPDWSDDRQIVVIAANKVRVNGETRALHGLVRLQLPPVPEVRYGQRVQASGFLLTPAADGAFNFREYLRRQSIHVLMVRPTIRIGDDDQRTPLGWLLGVNDDLRATMQRLLPEPHAGLLIGMLLGRQNAIAEQVEADFRATGTSHLLVISGWNISVLAGTLIGLLRVLGLGRRAAAILALPVVGLYVLFAGASPGVVRAGIMGGLVLWAMVADREADAWTSLLLACALLALFDPHVLWSVGFQLSVAGTVGVIAWVAPIERWIVRHTSPTDRLAVLVARPLAPTFAALLLVTPIVMYHFGTLQPIAPLANLIVAPAVPLAMLFGIIGTLAGLVALPFGQFVVLLAWPFTSWMVATTHWLAAVPWATVTVPSFGVGWVWAWYIAAALLAWRLRVRTSST